MPSFSLEAVPGCAALVTDLTVAVFFVKKAETGISRGKLCEKHPAAHLIEKLPT